MHVLGKPTQDDALHMKMGTYEKERPETVVGRVDGSSVKEKRPRPTE
jgi:hypothetical protein